jgi:hypothetical protein
MRRSPGPKRRAEPDFCHLHRSRPVLIDLPLEHKKKADTNQEVQGAMSLPQILGHNYGAYKPFQNWFSFVTLNAVKDLNPLKIRDSSLRSE